MELVPIFVDENSEVAAGLYAIRYNSGEPDEFERLFELWNDVEYLENFCFDNQDDLKKSIFGYLTVEKAVEEILQEAQDLEYFLVDLVHKGFVGGVGQLQMIFRPLSNNEYEIKSLQKTKASVTKTTYRRHPKLRIYAIRLASNLYIVTGGAIEFTATMLERDFLVDELKKIERVKNWLKSVDIEYPEDLNNYLNE